MPLRFTLKSPSSLPLEVEGITPDVTRAMSLAAVEKLVMFQGNRQLPLAEFFTVSGDGEDQRHEWAGDLSGVHWLGAKMKSGRIDVLGNVGRHLGSEISGGEIHVAGNASDWAGAEMHGGLIHIRGRVGHQVGAAYRGSPRGMTKGTILVDGDAGDEIGRSMRRGLIAIGGNAGDLIGMNMLAGSVFVCGTSGIRHGAGMKRGTLAFLSDAPPLLPSFRHSCRYRPEFLGILYRQLRQQGFAVPEGLPTAMYDLYCGDLIEGGRGEVLIRAA